MKYKTPKKAEDILDIAFDLQYRASKRCEAIENAKGFQEIRKAHESDPTWLKDKKRFLAYLETIMPSND